MKCLSCEHSLPPGSKFCPSCGIPVRRCEECGVHIQARASFCGNCGALILDQEATMELARVTEPAMDTSFDVSFEQELGKHQGCAILYRPTRPSQRYIVKLGDNTIGAGPKNDIVITDVAISWNHALLLCREDRIQLQDTASTNGTFLNGERVQRPEDVAHHDTLRLADVDFSIWLPLSRR